MADEYVSGGGPIRDRTGSLAPLASVSVLVIIDCAKSIFDVACCTGSVCVSEKTRTDYVQRPAVGFDSWIDRILNII